MDCSICLEPLDEPKQLVGCGHSFHADCIRQCGQTSKKFCPVCPLCRARLVECELGIDVVARYNADPAHPSEADFYVMKTAAELGCIAAAFALGNIYHKRGDAEGLDEHYWKMAENYSGACNNLAFLAVNKKDVKTAVHYFRKAIQLKPGCPVLRLNLAKALGATDEANDLLLSTLRLLDDPASKADIYFALGNNFYKQGRVATAFYEQCVAFYPTHFQARLMAAVTGTDNRAAHAHVDVVLAALPNHVGALCLKGRLCMREKNRAAAEPFFRKAMSLVPPGEKASYDLAASLAQFGPLTRKRARLCS
jgi:Flp pilus assembly protein TadD